MKGENPSDFGADKETVYHCAAALGRRACPLSLAPLAKAGLRLPASASLPLASCWPLPQQLLPVSATGGGRRRCPQRGSPWQAGPLPTGRLSPDMAQKGGPRYRGQARLCTTSPSRLRRATSPCRRGFGSPRKVNGFARGSPTRGAVERSETERLYEGKPDREPPAGLPSPSSLARCHCPGCGSQRLLRCRSHPAGRGPNSSSLFPPLAAVVAVAPKGRGFLRLFAQKTS